MNAALSILVSRLRESAVADAGVIPWSSPVPCFGDPSTSRVATLGINPSNREFVDAAGNELEGHARRFHTLRSLGIRRWADVRERHLRLIGEACKRYFSGNPYDTWFRKLDYILSGTESSYYGLLNGACHLDLIPYATSKKWMELTREQRRRLFGIAGDALGLLLRESAVRVLVLNGRSVVQEFESICAVQLNAKQMHDWTLPRAKGLGVKGIAYSGKVRSVAGIRLPREVTILGFNHNLQSSYGVTRSASDAIRRWLSTTCAKALT